MVRKEPRYIEVEGERYCECFDPEIVRAAKSYQAKEGDVFVATYPKCGTTWMIQTVMLILNDGEVPDTVEGYFSLCPFLEMLGPEEVEKMSPGKGCIKVHLPFDRTPWSAAAKYVYVARHPRDCCLSFFHHTRLFPAYRFSDGDFDHFFDLFVEGRTDFSDYFDNLLSWYDHRNDPNVFFVTYEGFKRDPRATIRRLAAFLGRGELSEELLELVVERSGFEHMRRTTNRLFGDMLARAAEWAEDERAPRGFRAWARVNASAIQEEGAGAKGDFVRKGQVGEGVLSPEQEERLRKRIEEKTKGSDVMSLWEDLDMTGLKLS